MKWAFSVVRFSVLLASVAFIPAGCSEEDLDALKAATDTKAGTDTKGNDSTDGSDGTESADGTDGTDGPIFENGCKSDADCAGVVFDSLGPCEKVGCDLGSKKCVAQNAADGQSCSDGDACTSNDRCTLGACAGSTKSCDDKNACTSDACDAASGECKFTPNDATCDDGNLCTTEDHCAAGSCTGTANPDCGCASDADCAKFEDADLCNGTLECKDKQCLAKAGTEVTCAGEGGPCSVSACEPATGECKTTPSPDGESCDDTNSCTKSDRCTSGKCEGKPVTCDDHEECTQDSCDPKSGCEYVANALDCDDGDPCTIDDACADKKCTGTNNPECACTTNADCEKSEDGDLCNGTLKCDAGKCVVDDKTVVDCSDEAKAAGACQTVVCEPTKGTCDPRPALDGSSCDDKDLCSTSDVCKDGKCGGDELKCDDKNPCTDDGCEPATGCTTKNNTSACDDTNSCTTGDACKDGVCAGTGTCGCTTTADCAPFEDKNLCNGTLACVEGKCVVAEGTLITCPAGSPCETTECIADTGKCNSKPKNENSPCDDGDKCSDSEACHQGSCVGKKVVCDDGNPCTDDTCEAATGCTQAFNNQECDDGVTCTTGDQCDLGACSGVPSAECACTKNEDCAAFEDKNACNGTLICQKVGESGKCVLDTATVVTCEPSGTPCALSVCNPSDGKCGLKNAADNKPCDDGSECTTGDRCKDGGCKGPTDVDCDDENPCTSDTCDAEFGCAWEANTETCDDGDPCSEGDVCSGTFCQPGETNTCEDTCKAAFALGCGDFESYGTDLFGATKAVNTYSCTDDEYPGGEYTYSFSAPFNGNVRVSLSFEDTQTDIHILAQSDSGCDPKACLTTGFASATTAMTEGSAYYFVVDGFFDEEGGYTISVDCTPSTETGCANGFDEDDDGDTDCEDTDCEADPACAAIQCSASWTLECGDDDSWATYSFGSTNAITEYDGCDNFFSGDYTGPEYTYVYDAPVTGQVTVALSDESSADTDLMSWPTPRACARRRSASTGASTPSRSM